MLKYFKIFLSVSSILFISVIFYVIWSLFFSPTEILFKQENDNILIFNGFWGGEYCLSINEAQISLKDSDKRILHLQKNKFSNPNVLELKWGSNNNLELTNEWNIIYPSSSASFFLDKTIEYEVTIVGSNGHGKMNKINSTLTYNNEH